MHAGPSDPDADAALRDVGTPWSRSREVARQLQDLITDRRSGSAQVIIRHAEGHLLDAQLTLAPVLKADGEVVHCVTVLGTLR